MDRAREDEIRDVELAERVGEIEVALGDGMELGMRMPLDDLDDRGGADVLVGYSQGAALAEQLVQRWPSRYSRIVLIGAPTEPSATKFAEARGIVTMSCARDVPWKMKEATKRIVRAGIPSTYLEMRDCTHGNITDGDKTFDAAFSFLRESSRPSP